MQMLIFCPPPIIAALLIGLGFGLDRLMPGLPRLSLPGLGLLLISSGLMLAASALAYFRALRTTFVPHGEPSSLVTAGPYVWTRNPMYLALLTALAGFALYFGSLPFYVVPPAFFLVIDRIFIPYEETKLSQIFGQPYADYRTGAKRWL